MVNQVLGSGRIPVPRNLKMMTSCAAPLQNVFNFLARTFGARTLNGLKFNLKREKIAKCIIVCHRRAKISEFLS